MTKEKKQLILENTVKVFGPCDWFRDLIVHEQHETTGGPTIEFKVNYNPIMERKNIIAFSQAAGCSYFFTLVDKNGNKAV
jgi:hypothetical protein